MNRHITYGQLREVLTGLGFQEIRRPEGAAFKHNTSDTVFLFRTHKNTDFVTPAELFLVRRMLDEKGLLESESFEVLLAKTPA